MFDLDRSYDQLDVCLGQDADKAKWNTLSLKPAPSIYERFVTAIKSGRADQPDVLRGAEIQSYLDACQRSASSGKWEKVKGFS